MLPRSGRAPTDKKQYWLFLWPTVMQHQTYANYLLNTANRCLQLQKLSNLFLKLRQASSQHGQVTFQQSNQHWRLYKNNNTAIKLHILIQKSNV